MRKTDMTMKKTLNIRNLAGIASLAVMLFCGSVRMGAQESYQTFTLTNGRLWWYEGADSCGDPRLCGRNEVAFNKSNSWAEVHWIDEQHVTHDAVRGNVYLRLDTAGRGSIVPRLVSNGLDPFCVWTRTGTTGYYYQSWYDNHTGITYRYYIVGSATTLRIVKIKSTDPIDDNSYWYNWDFGAALTITTYRNGNPSNAYHWLMFDTIGHGNNPESGRWRMSANSYQRPEDVIYTRLAATKDASEVYKTYYDPTTIGSGVTERIVPSGIGALYLPVTLTSFERSIEGLGEGEGFTNLAITTGSTPVAYSESVTVTPTIVTGGATVNVRPAYTLYQEEIERHGINLDYNKRKEPGFGYGGTPVYDTFYLYQGSGESSESLHTTKPPTVEQSLVVDSIAYVLSNSARRYFRFEGLTGRAPASATLHCYAVPPKDAVAKLTVTVFYTNGTHQEKTLDIPMSDYVERTPMPEPAHAPVIHGYVVGGGRMAKIGGNTHVTVHSCDSIYALYGGNDIAGWVQGDGGATIQIGTEYTNSTHGVHIGYVYGGGCGYYTYRGITFGPQGYPYRPGDGYSEGIFYQNYYFGSRVGGQECIGEVYPWGYRPTYEPSYTPTAGSTVAELAQDTAHLVWDASQRIEGGFDYYPAYLDPSQVDEGETGDGGTGTIPYVKHAHITVGVDGADKEEHNDYINIDTLFGGAENAFIGVAANEVTNPSRGTTIDIYGGTIYAVFGGNNYGGSVATNATSFVHVHGTKLTNEKATHNTYFEGFGRDFGIRYVYGGGNFVESSHANLMITGGMIDTCFLGGNRASVVHPIGYVNCTGDDYIFENDSITKQWVVGEGDGRVVIDPEPWSVPGARLVDRPLYDSRPAYSSNPYHYYDSLVYQSPGRFNEGIGRYNIRCFFGGNNNAPMNQLSVISLLSGGISAAYGGGNAGDMRESRVFRNIESFETTLHLSDSMDFGLDGWEYEEPSVIGSLVHSVPSSRIMVETLYGGCRMANVRGSAVAWLSGGTFGYVQGGNDISGDVGSETGEGSWVVLDRKALVLMDAYGGGDGYYHCHANGRYISTNDAIVDYNEEPYDPYDEYLGLLIPTQNRTNLYIHGGTVLYAAYGGGVMTDVGFQSAGANKIFLRDSANFTGTGANGLKYTNGVRDLQLNNQYMKGAVHFLMNSGTIGSSKHHGDGYGDGNAYGGGYLSSVHGLAYLKIKGKKVSASVDSSSVIRGSLYAGNDCMGNINSFGSYSIPGTDAEHFASSDGLPLNGPDGALYSAYVLLQGTPSINCVYGSGNGAYDYDGTRPEYSSLEPVCQSEAVDNRPFQSSTFIDINTEAGYDGYVGMIDTVFGGGNGVGVQRNVRILLNSKQNTALSVGTIFGGNNRDDMNNCVPDIVLNKGFVKNIFGGGNQGSMKGEDEFTDICGNTVGGVSTYILLQSEDMHVQDSIFGGCRMADVEGMAYIDMRKGYAKYIYGGNDISGSITGNTRIDVSGGQVDNIYGGSNGRYEYEQHMVLTQPGNIERLVYDVFVYGSTPESRAVPGNSDTVARNTSGSPFVDSTAVNLYGGIINNSVYGGGSLGDCRLTNVVVNDQICDVVPALSLTINGAVYGGGEGEADDLNKPRRGNVVYTDDGPGSTHVHLHHASSLSTATAYGGGRGGDVDNTYITAYSTWDQPFDALYGGCWGSDVHGTTHVVMEGSAVPEAVTANNVFGGNDMTGNVYMTDVHIINGTYGNIYGGGNGEYDADDYTTGVYAGGNRIYEPNNEYCVINFDNGTVNGNLYGGGKLGTTMCYKKDATGAYITEGAHKFPDTFRSLYSHGATRVAFDTVGHPELLDSVPYADPDRYSYIIVNVHGGTFNNSIYAGGKGRNGGPWIVYGLKMLNMEGGTVEESVYGGSENVNDGYPRECENHDTRTNPATVVDTTTMRPSSVINLAGGTIKSNVYGGGYLGNVYGSCYVNVGIDAIDSCPIWSKTIYGNDSAYWLFKPGVRGGKVAALTARELQLQSSIYGGANWGSNIGNANFNAQGFFGGEDRIIVDGNGYNTYMTEEQEDLPLMNIVNSIIGAGTSAEGGDIDNQIGIRNYGAVNPGTCKPTRTLNAIQRANTLTLENTAIDYLGSTDAISAYLSQQFTINRVKTLNAIGYNVIDLDATMTNVSVVNFLHNKARTAEIEAIIPAASRDDSWYYDDAHHYMYVRKGTIQPSNDFGLCNPAVSMCDLLGMVDRSSAASSLTAFVVNNGINVDIIGEDGQYGALVGFSYLIAQTGTNAVITARKKYGSVNVADGGFWTPCNDVMAAIVSTNNTHDGFHDSLVWVTCDFWNDDGVRDNPYGGTASCHCIDADATNWWEANVFEYPYYNYSETYRVWTLGQGLRRRYAVIQAHSNPHKLGNDINRCISLNYNVRYDDNGDDVLESHDTVYNFGIAKATLVLPPTAPGNYYRVDGSGVNISDENEEMKLVGTSYLPKKWWALSDEWGFDEAKKARSDFDDDAAWTAAQEAASHGGWIDPSAQNINNVHLKPGTFFGLVMASGKNFAFDNDSNPLPPTAYVGNSEWTGSTTIAGNDHATVFNNFATAKVGAAVNASPELDLYLLYNNNFSHTLVGTVTLKLNEYSADGTDLHSPIEVEITISTILEDFKNMEYDVLAMYNEGRSNSFSRKAILPATLQHRELYLKAVEWAPTDTSDGHGNGEWLTADRASDPDWFYLTGDSASIISDNAINRFRLSILPSHNISNTLVTAVGWHSISATSPVDIFTVSGNRPINSKLITNKPGTWKKAANYDNYDYDDATEPPEHPTRSDSTNVTPSTYATAVEGRGIKLGELDGRAEAAINLTLNYDGNKIYKKNPGKGYVGKVILTLVSFADGDYQHGNEFKMTVNVKTRDRGDTIYVASKPTITRNGITLTAREISGSTLNITSGKRPKDYLQTIDDNGAFNPILYQEGDVIAVLDTVKITGDQQLFIRGYEYMPVPIIRYFGHHVDFPDEQCVYRGPMIVVKGPNASFTSRCIEFHGGILTKITPNGSPSAAWTSAHPLAYNPVKPSDIKYADSNISFGPIIAVTDSATVTLQNSVVVEHNWNGYTGADPLRYGAISVTNHGVLQLVNNVTIMHNLSTSAKLTPADATTPTGTHPGNGAVYVDGGTVQLLKSNNTTATTIQDNYLYDISEDEPYWSLHKDDNDRLLRYDFDTTSARIDSYVKGNVLLARTPAVSAVARTKDMYDTQSDVIVFNDAIPTGTKIGVRKWFPGETIRDTIRIAYHPESTHLTEALRNNNFTSDDGYFTFYNYGVNNQYMYLQRCATFKYQKASLTPILTTDGGSSIKPSDVLSYHALANATCPIGGDTIVYRVRGGFFPYTYNWTVDGVDEREKSTNTTNNAINQQTKAGNFNSFNSAVSDTLITSHVSMSHTETSSFINYTVVANDITGNCPLQKNIKIELRKRKTSDFGGLNPTYAESRFIKTSTASDLYWTDEEDNAWNDIAHGVGDTARGERNYIAIQVTPRVWADRSKGSITALVANDDSVYVDDGSEHHPLENVLLCEGDIITLATAPHYREEEIGRDDQDNPIIAKIPLSKFIMWDFDPYYNNPAKFVVPTQNTTVTAYYGPLDYWKDTITNMTLAKAAYDDNFTYTNRNGKSFVTTYNGDVHIYDEDGLAWLISCVNGFNNTQARTYHFNRVYLHQKAGGYDMKKYLWTPLGTLQHPFEGMLIGVGSADACIDTTGVAPVTIKNIIINEPEMQDVGFFAVIDSARIINICLDGVMARGAHNVGALAARSSNSRVSRVIVAGKAEELNLTTSDTLTSILSTHYISGGLIGLSNHDSIDRYRVNAKYIGDAVYSGGVVGYGTSTTITNGGGRNDNRMRGLYLGSIAGYLDGTAPAKGGLFRPKTPGEPSIVSNNYFHVHTTGNVQRTGGVAGYAQNSILENNYIYGDLGGTAALGGVGAVLAGGTEAKHNYYEQSAAKLPAAVEHGNAVVTSNSDFAGQGNRVQLSSRVYGVDNLTRVLNLWVREHNAAGGDYLTWRSDLDDLNDGYPLFGQPDLIPIDESMSLDGCEEVEWDGVTYTADATVVTNTVDSTEMIDSTLTIHINVHHSTTTALTDSATVEEGYEGYGFTVTPTEAMLLSRTISQYGSAQMVLSDTLTTMFGCDSVVTLTLTFTGGLSVPEVEVAPTTTVNVYPNPTTTIVNVEAEQMSHVELYDNEGRTLADYDAKGNDLLTIDVSRLATGIYYLRVHTPTAVTIKKIVKR